MRIKFVKSEKLDLLSGAGLNLLGQILERHTTLRRDLNRHFLKQPHGLGTGDVVMAYRNKLVPISSNEAWKTIH
jgi:hypothetical protein